MSKLKNRARSQRIKAQKTRAAVVRQFEVVKLYYATHGLETSLDDHYIDGERDDWEHGDWEPNRTWGSVRVRRCDIAAWIAAMNKYLCGVWTPNQGFGHSTCDYDGTDDMAAAETEMSRLQVLAA